MLSMLAGAMLVVPALPAGASLPTSEAEPIPFGDVVVELERFVRIPNDSRPEPPRLNVMALAGSRLFVGEEHDGRIYEIVGRATPSPAAMLFFDVGDAIATATGRHLDTSSDFHGGLRGLAFHPDFAENGLFYTSVMESRPASPAGHRYLSDPASPIPADGVVIEWRYDAASRTVDPGSYREVFRVGMPEYDHPIKEIAFNPYARPGDGDYGLLYVAHGDGSIESSVVGGGLGNDGLGKIIRVNPLAAGAQPYTVPSSNPFVGNPAWLDELYTVGHRNPHNLSFARWNGQVYFVVGEAGRDNVEEINIIRAGANYGWAAREGTYVHVGDSSGFLDGLDPLPANEWTNGYTFPAAQWFHQFDDPGSSRGAGFVGQAAAGGYLVDNGSELSGLYLHADFAYDGKVFYTPMDELVAAKTTLAANQPPSALTQASISQAWIDFDHDDDPATAPIRHERMVDVLQLDPNYSPGGDVPRADLRFGQDADGTVYVMNKRNGWIYRVTNSIGRTVPVPGGGGGPVDFDDDDDSVFEADIEWLAARGITRGCNPPDNTRFCPMSPITRGEMAAFLVRALDLAAGPAAPFSDISESVFAGDIDRLAAADVTRGCTPTRFCPDEHVTREQMAAFLVRAYTPPVVSSAHFVDIDGSTFVAEIGRLAAAGVTRGCNPPGNDRYCPADLVTRGEMAAFIHRIETG
jgi:glucose/arabinose dehydrogenase